MSVYGEVLHNLVIQLTDLKPSLRTTAIAPESSLVADLGLDSLDLVELSTRLSAEYPAIDLAPWLGQAIRPGADTVGSLATFVAGTVASPSLPSAGPSHHPVHSVRNDVHG